MNFLELLTESTIIENGEALLKAFERGRVPNVSMKKFFTKIEKEHRDQTIRYFNSLINRLRNAGINNEKFNSYIFLFLRKARTLEGLKKTLHSSVESFTSECLDPMLAYFNNNNKAEAKNDEKVKKLFQDFESSPFSKKDKTFEQRVNKIFEEKATIKKDKVKSDKYSGGWEVFKPKNFAEAKAFSCMNSRKAKWCTAANSRFFNQYSKNSQLIIIKNEKKNVMFQLNFSGDEGLNFKNEADHSASVEEFMKHNPPEELLKALTNSKGKSVYDIVHREDKETEERKLLFEYPSGIKVEEVKKSGMLNKKTIEGRNRSSDRIMRIIGDKLILDGISTAYPQVKIKDSNGEAENVRSKEDKKKAFSIIQKIFSSGGKFFDLELKKLTNEDINKLAEDTRSLDYLRSSIRIMEGKSHSVGYIEYNGMKLYTTNRFISFYYDGPRGLTSVHKNLLQPLMQPSKPPVKGWTTRRLNAHEMFSVFNSYDKLIGTTDRKMDDIFIVENGKTSYGIVLDNQSSFDDGNKVFTVGKMDNRVVVKKAEFVAKALEQGKFPKDLERYMFKGVKDKALPGIDNAAKEITSKTKEEKDSYRDKAIWEPGVPNLGRIFRLFSGNAGSKTNVAEEVKKVLAIAKGIDAYKVLGVFKEAGAKHPKVILEHNDGRIFFLTLDDRYPKSFTWLTGQKRALESMKTFPSMKRIVDKLSSKESEK